MTKAEKIAVLIGCARCGRRLTGQIWILNMKGDKNPQALCERCVEKLPKADVKRKG